jgi:hypothetical protein
MALTDNLQAFYKLSDTSDSSGNNRTLTNNGNVSFASGKIGNAAVFDGSGLMEAFIPTTSQEVTFSFWYNSNSQQIPEWATAMDTFFGESAFGPRISMQGLGNLGVFFNGAYSSDVSIIDSTWHHVVMTFNSNGDLKLYDNNSVVMNQNFGSQTIDLNHVFLGNDIDSNSGSELLGLIDAVGIWNRALSDAEVAELYNNGTGLEIDNGGGGGGGGNPTLVKMQAPVKFLGKVKFGV